MLAQAMVMIGLYSTGRFIVRRATKSGGSANDGAAQTLCAKGPSSIKDP